VYDVISALESGRHCLVLTQWTKHLERLASALTADGHDPIVLRGGMGAKARAAEVHDYHDISTGVLASSLAKRAPGYTSLGFPDPRKFTR
jgi:hypothetical protein